MLPLARKIVGFVPKTVNFIQQILLFILKR